MYYNQDVPFAVLKGKYLDRIEASDDEITFFMKDGSEYQMYHYQDCCENVRIEEVVGTPLNEFHGLIVEAEEISNADGPEPEYADSYTWTFYKLGDINGNFCTIRWLGESNGYYGEGVDFAQTKPSNRVVEDVLKEHAFARRIPEVEHLIEYIANEAGNGRDVTPKELERIVHKIVEAAVPAAIAYSKAVQIPDMAQDDTGMWRFR